MWWWVSNGSSKQKGARGEREAAAALRALGIGAERGRQYHGGPDSPDIRTILAGIHFEVKRVERLNLSKAMQQAKEEGSEFDVPAVLSRKNREEWLLTIPLKQLWFFHTILKALRYENNTDACHEDT